MSATAPLQTRSKKTLEAILAATEALLEDTAFDRITVAQIVSNAGCTTGSFYARFDGKDALLPALYERYDKALPNILGNADKRRKGKPPSLADLLEEVVGAIAVSFIERPHLMRAMVLYARTQTDEISPETLAQRKQIIDRSIEMFKSCFDEIAHPQPARALHIALFVAIAALRDRILFPGAPNATTIEEAHRDFTAEVTAMAHAYLTTSRGAST